MAESPDAGFGEELLTGWGRAMASRASVIHARCSDDIRPALDHDRGVIARGLGRSYGDQATNAGGVVAVLHEEGELNPVTADGVITVPGGVSLDTLLRHVVPGGWFVPVSPGTRYVTVGGAVAADIHGKNHHIDGSFCNHVLALTLLLADGSVTACGPEQDSDLFWATAGGMGLTGVILDATIALAPIETSTVLVDTSRHDDLDDLLDAMVTADTTAPLSVAWVDLMSRDSRKRSVLTTGAFALADQLHGPGRQDPLAYRPQQRISAPPVLPPGLVRTSTARAFNELWFRMAPKRRTAEAQSISRYFHPLDGVNRWNRIYGPGGFLQWQMVVPDGAEAVLEACIETLSRSPLPCSLTVLKRFGPANSGPLSFPIRGWTLAVDIPTGGNVGDTLDALDRQVVEAGGRLYLAKDSRLDPALLADMYPRLEEWRAIRGRVDPDGVFQSDMDRRLGLSEDIAAF